ncbi:hypothetical protein GUJ93_ZPchr0014g47028 [Zizania palustris]|uniref:Uncharacterized protein n=1 Tax=Zizania palustris TaxID=103762 RepID=A0A8J5T8A1_ZIZPA|nr:hypothetical protein GUJ93_ZPchr0014g47028 [Zizania palustris]
MGRAREGGFAPVGPTSQEASERAKEASHRSIKIGRLRSPTALCSQPSNCRGIAPDAKDGDATCVESYVFWNSHEPAPVEIFANMALPLVGFAKTAPKIGNCIFSIIMDIIMYVNSPGGSVTAGNELALTCVGNDCETNLFGGHEIDWDSIVVEERSSEEGRQDVTSEQALYNQLGLGSDVEETFIEREDDGNIRNGDPRNHCEDGMGVAIPCIDVTDVTGSTYGVTGSINSHEALHGTELRDIFHDTKLGRNRKPVADGGPDGGGGGRGQRAGGGGRGAWPEAVRGSERRRGGRRRRGRRVSAGAGPEAGGPPVEGTGAAGRGRGGRKRGAEGGRGGAATEAGEGWRGATPGRRPRLGEMTQWRDEARARPPEG